MIFEVLNTCGVFTGSLCLYFWEFALSRISYRCPSSCLRRTGRYVKDVLAEPMGNPALRLVVAEQGEKQVEIK